MNISVVLFNQNTRSDREEAKKIHRPSEVLREIKGNFKMSHYASLYQSPHVLRSLMQPEFLPPDKAGDLFCISTALNDRKAKKHLKNRKGLAVSSACLQDRRGHTYFLPFKLCFLFSCFTIFLTQQI